ncbi:HIT family protein [Lactobacillus sp. DCY120]|uniref:HIT family protein n=1 Tax=Bombilactobacillus apium TaxID=2675299 RepID=A0A850R3E1_9LACO|nr:HIT family protein [Bombilactobacillus apium]NVY96880.1 HIT family protein [Bombilactobacillus apium]
MVEVNHDCVFCKIVAGEIPSYTVYEDDQVKAFLDISQVTPGHVLVVPKHHVRDIFVYDEELAATVFARIPKIARAIKASDPQIAGLNICINNGEIAYQTVLHSHIHLVPRYHEDDGFQMKWADNTANYTSDQLADLATKIEHEVAD